MYLNGGEEEEEERMAGWAYQSVSFYLGRCSLQRHCNSHFIGRMLEKEKVLSTFSQRASRVLVGDNIWNVIVPSYFTPLILIVGLASDKEG